MNVAAKSFAVTNEQDLLTNIVEKSVVSNYLCVGGYGFNSARDYCDSFDVLSASQPETEIFVSHIIKHMLSNFIFAIISF